MDLDKSKSDALVDLAKVGTMLVVSRALTAVVDGVNFFDVTWAHSSVYTILGFVFYDLVIENLVQTVVDNEYLASAVNDWLKVGTMLIVSRLLSGQSLSDPAWTKASIYTLIGFTAYDIGVKRIVNRTIDDPVRAAIFDDWVKVGTMMVVSQYLAGGAFNMKWAESSLFTLLGFTAYQVSKDAWGQ